MKSGAHSVVSSTDIAAAISASAASESSVSRRLRGVHMTRR
jgi:hypothetical protein